MARLSNTTIEELQQALKETEEKKSAQRLITAIAHKQGVTQSELADWFDVERKTIYNWLKRLEEDELRQAVQDRDRPGRPRKLDEEALSELKELLQKSPEAVDFDASVWTVTLVQTLLQNRFETEYSRSSCRRLMRECGLRPYTHAQALAKINPQNPTKMEKKLQQLGHVWMPI